MDFERLKRIIKKKGFTLKEVITLAELNEATFYNCVKRNSIETKNLEKIAEVLGVEIGYFFGNENDNSSILIDYTHTYLNIYYLLGYIDDFLDEFNKIGNKKGIDTEKLIKETRTYQKYLMFLAILAKDEDYNKTISDLKAAAKEFEESKEYKEILKKKTN